MQLLALIADDDPMACNIVLQAVRSIGFRGIATRGFQETLTQIEQDQPEIVFSELDLADGSGLSLQFEVRSRLPRTRFVLMCRQPTVEIVIEALRCGVSDLLPKPVNSNSVRDRVICGIGRSPDSKYLSLTSRAGGSADAIIVQVSAGLKQINRTVALAAVRRFEGNKSDAARALGISRRTLYRLLAKK